LFYKNAPSYLVCLWLKPYKATWSYLKSARASQKLNEQSQHSVRVSIEGTPRLAGICNLKTVNL